MLVFLCTLYVVFVICIVDLKSSVELVFLCMLWCVSTLNKTLFISLYLCYIVRYCQCHYPYLSEHLIISCCYLHFHPFPYCREYHDVYFFFSSLFFIFSLQSSKKKMKAKISLSINIIMVYVVVIFNVYIFV